MNRAKALAVILIAFVFIAGTLTLKTTAVSVFNEAYASNSTTKRKIPIYSVETEQKVVSLSFDAAWGSDDTDLLLKILKDEDVKATFFLCGYWVKKYPDVVKKIAEEGHDIGNHGDTHAHGAQLSKEQNKAEIQGVHDKVKELLGIDINLFRPPYGEYNNTVIEAADELSYYTIQWDVDSWDWMKKGVEFEINHVLNHKNLKNGSILLFHNDTRDTPEALPSIIKGLKEKGYSFLPISQLIHKENYTIDGTGRQIKKD